MPKEISQKRSYVEKEDPHEVTPGLADFSRYNIPKREIIPNNHKMATT
jgi:hypothetical protein